MGYRDLVRGIIHDADIVMEIIDSRFPQASRNIETEELVERSGKKLLVVINKSDMISKRNANQVKENIGKRCVFVSAKYRKGVARLRIEVEKLCAGKEAKIAVIGYPNTGKSSVINMLKGRKAALTSSIAGFTKGKQFVRISTRIMLIDSPGVIPIRENDETLMVLLSAKNPQHLSDLGGTGIDVAQYLLGTQKEELERHYGIEAKEGEEFLEKLAFRRNKLVKGGKPDLNAAARTLIDDFQKGAIKAKHEKSAKAENEE